jgi:hypothetical protein
MKASNDPIPIELKNFFFKNQKPPNLLTDYDAIGFDADHSMVKYKLIPTG